ncbi:hypothetical protein BDW22DRAFT_417453 [Trametopsis cervina]|nr:hypothetical protein BDW22DRAFT_417453 [Trametopsis cervina]
MEEVRGRSLVEPGMGSPRSMHPRANNATARQGMARQGEAIREPRRSVHVAFLGRPDGNTVRTAGQLDATVLVPLFASVPSFPSRFSTMWRGRGWTGCLNGKAEMAGGKRETGDGRWGGFFFMQKVQFWFWFSVVFFLFSVLFTHPSHPRPRPSALH